MKSKNAVKTAIKSINQIFHKIDNQLSFRFSTLPPLAFTLVTEKFDAVEHYRIRDGFNGQ
ncbi:MAG TPA: hypothetical protein VK666_00535 [Chryseolinea sp.]|nr:hypothetical protein [Chryseolinea sp.]